MRDTGVVACLLLILPIAGTVQPPGRFNGAQPQSFFRQSNDGRDTLHLRLKECAIIFRAARYLNAAGCYEAGYQSSLAASQPGIAARFLANLGACHLALHQYQKALESSIAAKKLAESVHDAGTAGAVEANLASIYEQMGETGTAIQWAERGLAQISGDDRVQHLPKVLIQLASLYARQGRMPQAVELFRRGIEGADRIGDLNTYALGWDRLGEELLKRNDLAGAERALLEAFRVRKLQRLAALETSYRNLGRLRLAQGDPRSSSALLGRAVELSRAPRALMPPWDIYHALGQARLAEGREREALEDFRTAIRLVRTWRRGVSPADATRVSAEQLIDQAYASLIEAATRLYFRTGRTNFATEAFEAAEENRAASLRALLASDPDWQRRLPSAYWETLARLQAAEVDLLRRPDGGSKQAIERLRAELTGMESRSGGGWDVETPGLLERTRRALPEGAAYLSFHLGEPDSGLWALDASGLSVYRLPGRRAITTAVEQFRAAVRRGGPEAAASGAAIYRTLFGSLDRRFQARPRWLLALDEALFAVPYPALVVAQANGRPVYLAERHATQTVSGAGLLGAGALPAAGQFVGVGDPIYNTADPRWHARPSGWYGPWAWFSAVGADDSFLLSRLPASRHEVDLCAAAWNGPRPVLLTGAAASKRRLREALAGRPAVVHLATHVLTSGERSRHGLVALSLGDGGRPEILDPLEISAWQARPGLVVLSGCASGNAEAPRGSGLMGLTRAWLAAGAGAVVASYWPTPDDSGTLFRSFYTTLRTALPPAVALQRAQLAMLRSGDWRAQPRYWSAWFLVGNQ